MGRAPCCDKANVKKGPWSPEEDAKLKEFMDKYGTGGNWIALPQKAGLRRCGKSCRLRWLNYLRPNIKHGEFSDEEDKVICTLFTSIGSRWSIIAGQLPGRTDNDIKNYWNTKLKKKLMGMMIPSSSTSSFTAPHAKYSSHLPFSNTFQAHHHQPLSLSTLSQLYRDYNNSLYLQTQIEPTLPPQNLLFSNNSDTFSLTTASHYPYSLQSQERFVDFQYGFNGKESNSNMLVFGGNEASCSSSDGSCSKDQVKQEEIACGFHGLYSGFEPQNHKLMLHNGMSNSNAFVEEKQNGVLGSCCSSSSQLQCDMEQVKQLISSDNNVGSCTSFVFNHDEREMYYF